MASRIFRAFILAVVVVSLVSIASAHAEKTPRVLAFYYAWFDQNTWNPALVPDLPAPPYSSNDPTALARHIQQAQRAGIDAFVVSWIGQNNSVDANFRTLLNLARGANFAATIDFETQHFATRDQVIAALSYIRDTYSSHPAFLRDGGKPVIFFWREQNF